MGVVHVLLIVASVAAAAVTSNSVRFHHFLLSPARLLNEDEQADLGSRGLIIERPLSGGRYLVRVTDDATVADDDPRVRMLTPLSANLKLHRTALREVANGGPYARLEILFHDEVSFESAKAAIEAAGGSLAEPLQHDFHVPQRISARIAAIAVSKLAADERVLLVYSSMRLEKIVDNAVSAAISNITPLVSAPYGLSGQGVTLSSFE